MLTILSRIKHNLLALHPAYLRAHRHKPCWVAGCISSKTTCCALVVVMFMLRTNGISDQIHNSTDLTGFFSPNWAWETDTTTMTQCNGYYPNLFLCIHGWCWIAERDSYRLQFHFWTHRLRIYLHRWVGLHTFVDRRVYVAPVRWRSLDPITIKVQSVSMTTLHLLAFVLIVE